MTRTVTHDPNLSWLLDAVWGTDPETGARGTSYRVIPNTRRARMLVPDDDTIAVAALRAGAGTRSPRAQRARSLATLGLRAGVFRDRVRMPADDLLSHAIAEACGVPAVWLAAAIRRPSPFRKPVLQVLTPDARVIAYAKVAWNDLTAANVRAEHTALTALAGAERIAAPEPIALLEHRGFPLLLTRPMPEDLQRYARHEPPSDPRVSTTIARVLATSAGPDPIGVRLRQRLAATAGSDLTTLAASTQGLVDALGARATSLQAGAWHGDWSPWNLGWANGRLWAWDWEYCRPDVPLGLDVPHFLFQRHFIGDRAPVDRAFRESAQAAAPLLAALGYDATARATVGAVHVAEISVRYLEVSSLGIAANPRFLAGAEHAIRDAIDGLA